MLKGTPLAKTIPWPSNRFEMDVASLTAGSLRLASVEITQRCSNHCCDQPKANQDILPTRFAALLDELVAEDIEAVALGGGEPTLHPALPVLLEAAHQRGLHTGLTTNARDPGQVSALADAGLLDSFGVSAGKGEWQALVAHPRAIVNLLLLRGGLSQVMGWACEVVHLPESSQLSGR